MGAPKDPKAHDEAAPSQESSLPPPPPPPPVTGVPVVALPPLSDYAAWSTGLCDCFSDFERFCISFWCPCVTFGQISEIVDRGSSSCGLNGAVYFLIACVTGCSCCYSFFYRLKMRKQYRIDGTAAEDFIVHCLCEACALTQEYRELKNRGFNPSLGWHESVDRQNHGVAMAPMPPVAPIVEDGMKR
ncbi:protein PLANT CADMIUM RESISTANCE 2-like isoform X1 [Rhodamnia argentea]|uniref:Protein PLANT CADMIUM RESISTANCE 2-like isoform X1 n=1 Tax=Rhodamnia argentea TaxID=178133 RepID=A0A8B8R0T4_9MYRT|nr:protein PLANT CADMIUM RESISTANCE 2-like isoform X1 [Rhodamnia argentea]